MRIKVYITLVFSLLVAINIFLCVYVKSQTGGESKTINFPFPYEDLSLYDFAKVRFETDKTDTPPPDLINRNFRPVKNLFAKDSLYFSDSVQNVWLKFKIRNNLSRDTSVALIFPGAVSKAVLYKSDGERLILIGKTGFMIAVRARAVYYEDNRIDLSLNAQSETNYFIQVIFLRSRW